MNQRWRLCLPLHVRDLLYKMLCHLLLRRRSTNSRLLCFSNFISTPTHLCKEFERTPNAVSYNYHLLPIQFVSKSFLETCFKTRCFPIFHWDSLCASVPKTRWPFQYIQLTDSRKNRSPYVVINFDL